MIPFIFIAFISFAIFFIVVTHYRGKGYGKDFEAYINEEKEANAIRNKPIGEDDYFKPDMSVFPIKQNIVENDAVSRKQADVIRLSEKKMMRFDAPMTNTELKHRFGTVNLEHVTEYEENFYKFIYAVNGWAEALIDAGDEDAAIRALEGGVKNGAETSKTYTILADIYFKRNMRAEMRGLYDIARNKNMPAREKVRQHINDYYIKMGL